MNDATLSSETLDLGPATPEQIRELPLKYAIGKRPLSRLLGWGELTYTRLLDGGVPNAAHSDEIRRLLDDPAAFARLLEIGREHKVITGVAYEKSRRAVDALLAEGGHDESGDPLKIFAVADRICALTGGDVTPRTLQMLMHVAQERAAAAGEEPLFEQVPNEVEWGFEYPQIAAGYSFVAIQGVAARLKGLVAEVEAEAVPEPEAEPTPEIEEPAEVEVEPEPIPEPEPEPELEPSKKKGKKDKKGKKGKGKDKKKDKDKKAKKAAKLAAELQATSVAVVELPPTKPEPEPAPEKNPAPVSASKPIAAPRGPLSAGECRLVDEVVARYRENLKAAFA